MLHTSLEYCFLVSMMICFSFHSTDASLENLDEITDDCLTDDTEEVLTPDTRSDAGMLVNDDQQHHGLLRTKSIQGAAI